MNKKKKPLSTQFTTVLIFYTFIAVALGAYIAAGSKDTFMLLQIVAKLVICWAMRFIPKIPDNVEKWVGYALAMHSFVQFGLSPDNIEALAFMAMGLCALFLTVEFYELVNVTVVVYFLTFAGNLLFVSRGQISFTPGTIALLVIQCVFILLMVYFTGRLKERRKENNRLNEEIIRSLEEENRRTENFLTNVSHELRTPINAVTGLTAVMLKNENDSSKRDNLFSIQKAGYRLFGQIEDILDYTEIDTGKIKASDDQYMLSSLVNDIITERSMTEEKDNLEIIFDVEPKIPAMLIGDSKKIRKVIKHLLDNAVKFTDAGGVYVRIYSIPKEYGLNLCIQVTDTGIGMDSGSLSRITERFYQSNSGRERRAGGLGLGLPIVLGMVSAMEGFVHIDSNVGEGTHVTVSIPQRIADDAPGMRFDDPEKLCIGCYITPEKYKVSQIRHFYDKMISNLATGLDVSVHRVYSKGDLEKLLSSYQITHLLLADEEYEADREFFESLDETVQVIVIAKKNYPAPKSNRIKIIRKPFFCFPVVTLINSKSESENRGKRMICPDVKALVVDDEPMNRMVAEGILSDYQMSVKTAASGVEAIEMCSREDFDILFIDHMMPEMDGVEALKQLRRLNTDAAQSFAAIAFTANAVSGAREMFLREGFDDFLPKPVEVNELERVLRKVLPITRIQYVDEKDIRKENLVQDIAPKSSEQDFAEENPDELTLLRRGGINVEEALEYCRSDKDFYIKLLQKYVADFHNRTNELNGLLEKEDYAGYRIQVHSLKSSSKMMGAEELSEFAKEMEAASKENNGDFIKENHEKLMKQYADTVKLMREAIGAEDNSEENAEEEPAGTEISSEELIGYLEELKRCFETYEADKSQTLISELSKTVYNGKSVKKMLTDINRDVEEFEYESASEKAGALIEQVKGGGA